jgi:hypothetical protein
MAKPGQAWPHAVCFPRNGRQSESANGQPCETFESATPPLRLLLFSSLSSRWLLSGTKVLRRPVRARRVCVKWSAPKKPGGLRVRLSCEVREWYEPVLLVNKCRCRGRGQCRASVEFKVRSAFVFRCCWSHIVMRLKPSFSWLGVMILASSFTARFASAFP